MAEKKDEIKSMMGRLEEYLKEKELELNASKIKVIRFKRKGDRKDKRM